MNTRDNIPQKLSEIKKEIPFRVPGNYFEDFQSRLQARLHLDQRNEVKSKGIKVIDLIKPALSLAAAIAAVFLMVYWPVRFVNKQHYTEQSSENHSTSLIEDIDYLIEEMDDNTFFSLFHNGSGNEIIEPEIITNYLVSCNSEYDIYLETLK
jgi:hypothetical protein